MINTYCTFFSLQRQLSTFLWGGSQVIPLSWKVMVIIHENPGVRHHEEVTANLAAVSLKPDERGLRQALGILLMRLGLVYSTNRLTSCLWCHGKVNMVKLRGRVRM